MEATCKEHLDSDERNEIIDVSIKEELTKLNSWILMLAEFELTKRQLNILG